MNTVLFSDSHGGFWAVCSPLDDDAQAFGPMGAAKETRILGCGSIAKAVNKGVLAQIEALPEYIGDEW